jgi:hypothetical protein
MSELKVDKISPQSGTATTIGDSGDTFTVPSGATLTVAGALNVTGTTALADGTVAIAELDIDGGTDIGEAIVDADLFVIDNGAGGTNRKTAASRLTTYILGANSIDSDMYVDGSIDLAHLSVNSIDSDQYVDGSIDNVHLAGSIADSKLSTISTAGKVDIGALEIDGATDIGAGIADADLFIVDDGGGGTERKTAASRLKTYMAGKQTIWVPSAAITPTQSNGCADRTQVETTAGRPDIDVLDFDDGSDEHAQFSVAFPKQWDLGTVTFQVFWTTTATDTDGVAFGLQGVAVSNDDTIDVAYGTAVVVTDDNISAAEDALVTSESSAVTIAGTPADDDLCYFRFFRDVSDANDDMTEDARLIGVKLFYTTDAVNDD